MHQFWILLAVVSVNHGVEAQASGPVSPRTVWKNQNVYLACTVYRARVGPEVRQVTWFLNSTEFTEGQREDFDTLRFNVTKTGYYGCSIYDPVENTTKNNTAIFFAVTAFGPPLLLLNGEPKQVQSNKDLSIFVNESDTSCFEIKVETQNMRYKISWSYFEGNLQMDFKTSKICFQSWEKDLATVYVVIQAQSIYSKSLAIKRTLTFLIKVRTRPRTMNLKMVGTVFAGTKNQILSCPIYSNQLLMNYTWFKVKGDKNIPITQNKRDLFFKTVSREDAGYYICIGRNQLGNATAKRFLEVYEVSSPKEITIYNITTTTASLRWTEPLNSWRTHTYGLRLKGPNGSPIYALTCKTEYVLTDLIPNTDYELSIEASSAQYTSMYSKPFLFKTRTEVVAQMTPTATTTTNTSTDGKETTTSSSTPRAVTLNTGFSSRDSTTNQNSNLRGGSEKVLSRGFHVFTIFAVVTAAVVFGS